MTYSLRDYQEKFVSGIRQEFAAGNRRVMGVLPTGGGKTVCFCYMSYHAAIKGNRTYIVVHRQELIKQTSKALRSQGIPHGIIWGKKRRTDAPIQIVSVDTIIRCLDKLDPPDFLVIDEGHHGAATKWRKVIEWASTAALLLVTATPQRLDGRGFADLCDVMVVGPSVAELIDGGWLTAPVLIAPPLPDFDLSRVHTRAGDYAKEELEELIDKPQIIGSAVDQYLKDANGLKAVAFCPSVKAAKNLADAFNSAGVPAASVDGSMKDADRERVLDDLATGKITVVTNCDLISEGFDLPAISCAILLTPTQSLSKYLQQVGRALRPADGKSETIILDHVQNWLRHGLVQEPRTWSLHSEKRGKRKVELTIPVKQCPKCYACFAPAPQCPRCGHTFAVTSGAGREIETVAGELVRIDFAAAQAARQQRERAIDNLKKIEKQKGYRKGWAERMARRELPVKEITR
jgi:DNA repair protein RadD